MHVNARAILPLFEFIYFFLLCLFHPDYAIDREYYNFIVEIGKCSMHTAHAAYDVRIRSTVKENRLSQLNLSVFHRFMYGTKKSDRLPAVECARAHHIGSVRVRL